MEFGELLRELTLVLNTLHRRRVCSGRQTLSQCFLLLSIPDGGVDMSTLSSHLGLDNSTMTRLVRTLENKDLVGREKAKADRRVTLVSLTEKGEELADEIERTIDSMGEEVLSGMSTERREDVHESLETVLWSLTKATLKHPS
ncbi:MAG: MarR family transcriptional regulator [Candidatus Neomarinimicrobiota bacterium]